MSSDPATSEVVLVLAPREGVNDDFVRIVEWRVPDGARVSAGQTVAVVETTKAAIDIVADRSGFLHHAADVNADVPVGAPVAAISGSGARPTELIRRGTTDARAEVSSAVVVTAKARLLLQRHGFTENDFPALGVIRSSDVEQLARERATDSVDATTARASHGVGRSSDDWDSLLEDPEFGHLVSPVESLRRQMRAKFDRHVPTGSLLHDRWKLARDNGFGEGTSVYDECLIIGQVTVGRRCWIGPFTVLDGQGGLRIGDFVDIGAGAHLYSHNTIERALTGRRAAIHRNATSIGNCCFIAPHAIIGAGTIIGDHCFVAAGSYVEGTFPDRSFIAGNPARIVGEVTITGTRASIRRTMSDSPEAES